MNPDPTMPRAMPLNLEREIERVLGRRYRPNPVDVYNAVRDELLKPPELRPPRDEILY